MPRHKLEIPDDQVVKLATLGATNVDIADFFGCDEATIRKRFSETLRKGRADRRNTLRKWQWDCAGNGNVAMLIWLGKQDLGQADKIESKAEIKAQVSDAAQRRMLSDPGALELACSLDERLSRPDAPPGDDPGGVCA